MFVSVQGAQILHAGRLGPTEGVPVGGNRVRHADDLAKIVDAEGFAVIAVGQNAEILHSPVFAPEEGVGRGRSTVGGAYNLTGNIDSVGPTLFAARHRAQGLYPAGAPEDGRRALA